MAIPLLQIYRVAKYLAGRKLRGDKRYPLVLMLEPLFQCNLACAGCGKIDYPKEILQKRVSVEDALHAVDECGAPIVSIPGGEPLIHKEMPQIVAGIVARKKFVYLCTNAILLAKHIDEYRPSPYLTFSIHLDGNRRATRRVGVPGGRVRQGGGGDHAGAQQGLSRHHQLHACSTARIRMTSPSSSIPRCALGIEGHHGLTGLQLSPRAAPGRVPGPQRQQAAVPRDLQAPAPRRRQSPGRSIIPAFSWISSPAIRPINARHGAIRHTTYSAGSGRAICCPMRAMRRPTARSSRTPTGTTTVSAAIPAATTAWRTAGSRERPSTTPSAIRSRP